MIYEVELRNLRQAMVDEYGKEGRTIPKFSLIIVTKKINARGFADKGSRFDNPPPGTIIDSVITLPERYDFFLISCAARQGTVSPCSYNILYDDQGLDVDKLQMITYKMCHMYFNWSGTVAVPAPCQYAHKLAFLTATAYSGRANDNLAGLLHFL